MAQAYDRVWPEGLIAIAKGKGVGGNTLAWITEFLSNRSIRVRVANSLSESFPMSQGLPQGSDLSCTIFVLFLDSISEQLATIPHCTWMILQHGFWPNIGRRSKLYSRRELTLSSSVAKGTISQFQRRRPSVAGSLWLRRGPSQS